MNTTSIPGRVLAVLLTTLLTILFTTFALGTCRVWAEDSEDVTVAANTAANREERAYQKAIQDIESSEGAYAAGLSESLLSLALTLQAQGRHAEAITLFRRGTHLSRVNEGLYCLQQIPLLQGEIASHLAAQDYALADERQRYLYRVQMRALGSGDALAEALMQQGKWQYDAYQLGLGTQGYTHLMEMWNLYQQALQDVSAREGEKSPKCLPPLHGMLQAQYLISNYELRESQPVFEEERSLDEPLLRFKSYRAGSYQHGNAIIDAIAVIEQERAATDSKAIVQTLVMRGDWRLWNGRTKAAWQAYREAETELARAGDAQVHIQQLFGEPVALPDLVDRSPLPPTVDPQQADILLAFGVSEQGQVQDLRRMDDNEAQDQQASRLIRQLRRTTFRPRFAAGQPVETEHIVKAFNF